MPGIIIVLPTLKQVPGIVSLDPVSEKDKLWVTFNSDQISPEVIVAQLE